MEFIWYVEVKNNAGYRLHASLNAYITIDRLQMSPSTSALTEH